MSIDINKQYRTREGSAVTILSTSVAHPEYPVVGVITGTDGKQWPTNWALTGKHNVTLGACNDDLIEVQPPVVTFANVYPKGGVGNTSKTLRYAQSGARAESLGVLEICIEDGKDPVFTFHKKA